MLLLPELLIIIGACITAVLLGVIIIPNILLVSFRKRLFDVPDVRKVHKLSVPRLGGVCFFPITLFCICTSISIRILLGGYNGIFSPQIVSELLLVTAGLTLLYIIGVKDDLVGVRYRKKFLVQLFAAAMIPLSGLYINNLYGLLGIYTVPSFIGIPLTLLLVIFITNAINLIDGIDGLASGLSMVILAVFGSLLQLNGLWLYSLIAFVTIGVLIPFFLYNVFGRAERGRKIFMGDTGSLFLGYLVSLLTIKYCMYIGKTPWNANEAHILVAFSVLLVPTLDVCRVVLRRIRNGRNPFLPDKTHIHHKFMDMGFTPRASMILIMIMSASFCAVNLLLLETVNNTLLFFADIVVWTGLNLWFDKRIKSQKKL